MSDHLPALIPALIFDLDGTLTDSKPGILGCLREVLDERNIVDRGPLDRFIGPPVEEWVTELLPDGTEEDRASLARDYRACYDRVGWRNNSVFPGVAEMLARLRREGFPLYMCTSKQEHFAVRILETFELARFFAAIYGDKLEYREPQQNRSPQPDLEYPLAQPRIGMDGRRPRLRHRGRTRQQHSLRGCRMGLRHAAGMVPGRRHCRHARRSLWHRDASPFAGRR